MNFIWQKFFWGISGQMFVEMGKISFMVLRGLFLFSLCFSVSFAFSQKLYEDRINVEAGKGVDKKNAIIYLPANYSKSKAYPLVIFTHGMGEAGNNIKKLYKQGLPKVLK